MSSGGGTTKLAAALLRTKRSGERGACGPTQPGAAATQQQQQQQQRPSKRHKPSSRSLGSEQQQHSSGRQRQQHQPGSNGSRQPPLATRQQHAPSPSAGTGAPAAAAADGADDEGEEELPEAAAAGGQAYSALMQLLSRQRGQLASVLKQQQAQQEGLSDASDSDSEGSSGSEGRDGSERGDGSESGDAAASDEGGSSSSGGSDADGADAQADTAQQTQAHSAETAAAATGPLHSNGGDAAAAATASSSSSHWHMFMSRELTDGEAAALRSGGNLQWQDAPPAAAAAAAPAAAAAAAANDAGVGGAPSQALWPRAWWQFAGRAGFPPAPAALPAYGVKERLVARWREVAQEDAARAAAAGDDHRQQWQGAAGDFVSGQQRLLFSLCDSYADVLHACKPYPGSQPGWRPRQPDAACDAVLLHVLNHCAKTADVIKKNNDRAKGLGAADAPRDQGFTRPKALILLPMRNMAFAWVTRLVALAQRETRADSVQGKEKFVEQFAGDADDLDAELDTEVAAAAAAAGSGGGEAGGSSKQKRGAAKPREHRALFRGNMDDHFRLGIRITRGQIKLFADPLQSDIIVASPLALATKLAEDAAADSDAAAAAAVAAGGGRGKGKGKGGGGAGGARGGRSSSSGAADFLSSIELCVLERADVMLMQNWQHVTTVLEALNQLPQQQHGVNIMRVKMHLLAGQGALYRQTIMTSSFATPQLNAAFARLCASHAGKFRLVPQPSGVLGQVVPQVRQLFERFETPSPAAAADARLATFKASLWPRLTEGGGGGGLLLVVPSYFDFVRLRSFLRAEEADFAALSEYSEFKQVTRARALFFQRHRRLLLYTERAHFYHRYRIRGIQDIVFYGLPDHAHFYAELLNLVQTSGAAAGGHHATVTSLFCQFDALALARVVGAGRAAKMLAPGSSPTFVFC